MNARNLIKLNALTNALIEAGIINNVVSAPVPTGCSWDDFDRVSQANILASAIHTAYAAVVNANWREEMGETTAFDNAVDDFPYQEEYVGGEPRNIQTLDEAICAASVVRTMVRSYASDNKWLMGWANLEVVRDSKGQLVLDEDGGIKKEVKVVRSFSCDIDQFFEVDASTDQAWKDKLDVLKLKTRTNKIRVPYDADGIDAVKSAFLEWLDFVPWSQEEDARTRLERIAQKAGDKKWGELKIKALTGKSLDVKDLRHWVLIAYSPKFQADAITIRKSDEYIDWVFDQELEVEEAEHKAAEIVARKSKLDAIRQARMDALLGVSTPAVPAAPVLTPEVPAGTKKNGDARATPLGIINNASGIPSYEFRR